MQLKQLFSITLALVSFSTMADTTKLPTDAEKTADTSSNYDKKSDTTTPASEKTEDTSAAPKEKDATINITVTIRAKDVAGVGYSVEGTESGEAGNTHSGVGPSNKSYSFGYRKHPKIHENIKCGTAMLTKDSNVTLIVVGESCRLKVEQSVVKMDEKRV